MFLGGRYRTWPNSKSFTLIRALWYLFHPKRLAEKKIPGLSSRSYKSVMIPLRNCYKFAVIFIALEKAFKIGSKYLATFWFSVYFQINGNIFFLPQKTDWWNWLSITTLELLTLFTLPISPNLAMLHMCEYQDDCHFCCYRRVSLSLELIRKATVVIRLVSLTTKDWYLSQSFLGATDMEFVILVCLSQRMSIIYSEDDIFLKESS